MHRDICTQPKLYAKQRVNSLWASVYNRCHASYNRWLWFRMHISVCLSVWQTEKPNGFHAIWTSRTHLIWMSLYSIWNCKNSCILIKKHFSFERFRIFFCCVNVFCFSTAIAFCKKRALYETSDRRISLWALANTPNRVAHQCHFTSEVFFLFSSIFLHGSLHGISLRCCYVCPRPRRIYDVSDDKTSYRHRQPHTYTRNFPLVSVWEVLLDIGNRIRCEWWLKTTKKKNHICAGAHYYIFVEPYNWKLFQQWVGSAISCFALPPSHPSLVIPGFLLPGALQFGCSKFKWSSCA